MDFYTSLAQWCDISAVGRTLIVTDETQRPTAEYIQSKLPNCGLCLYQTADAVMDEAGTLAEKDLLIVLLSLDTYVYGGANRVFSPFAAPEGLAAGYIFIRLDITKESLLQGLATPKAEVYEKLAQREHLGSGALRVTAAGGTDIRLEIEPFETCSHELDGTRGYAFLPPSETSAEVRLGKANGRIVVDITVGQLYYRGELLNYFGRVAEPVIIEVRDGIVTDINGGKTADELKRQLFALPADCRELVELGQGLSRMTPTGLIGVDESIIDSCHFGIGDGMKCGLHLDVVVASPTMEKL